MISTISVRIRSDYTLDGVDVPRLRQQRAEVPPASPPTPRPMLLMMMMLPRRRLASPGDHPPPCPPSPTLDLYPSKSWRDRGAGVPWFHLSRRGTLGHGRDEVTVPDPNFDQKLIGTVSGTRPATWAPLLQIC